MNTLLDVLAQRARNTPDAQVCISLNQDLSVKKILRCAELHAEATRLALQLQSTLPEKSSVALLFDCGVDFLPFYFAVLMAGMQAIPLCPGWRRSEQLIAELLQQTENLAFVVADSHCSTTLSRLRAHYPSAQAFAESHFDKTGISSAPASTPLPVVHAGQTAHIQFSSGSAGKAKGVVLSHANVMDNLARIEQAFQLGQDDKGLIWLPLYHDMGLIGGLLAPLYSGFPVYTIKPANFSADPSCWLRAIARYGVTISGGPNSAYDMCSRIDLEPGHRLESWRVAFVGAEPVLAHTMRDFSKKWQAQGFNARSLLSCYGLAESTLMVTAGDHRQGAQSVFVERSPLASGKIVAREHPSSSTLELISSGKEVASAAVQIFDQDGQPCPHNQVGEIGVAGAGLSSGYVRDEEKRWRSISSNGQVYFLTGDEGYLSDDKQLYVLARQHEKIQIGGRSIYLSDMEACLKEKLRDDRSISELYCALDTASNSITVFVETAVRSLRSDAQKMQATLRADQLRTLYSAEFFMRYGIGIGHVHLQKKGSLPRTSSGKVQRHLLASLSASVESPAVRLAEQTKDSVATGSGDALYLEEEIVIAGILREVINITSAISHEDSFYSVGGSSIHVAPVISRINAAFGVNMEISEFMQNNSIRHLALKIIASKEYA